MSTGQNVDDDWDFVSEISDVQDESNRWVFSQGEVDDLIQGTTYLTNVTGEIYVTQVTPVTVISEVDEELAVDIEERARLASSFIDKIDTINGYRRTSVKQLCIMLENFPTSVWVESIGPNDTLELCFERAAIIEQLRLNQKLFETPVCMTSFERGLKHAGLEVLQTTHAGDVKRWGFKEGFVAAKKTEKRRRKKSIDDDYHDAHIDSISSTIPVRKRSNRSKATNPVLPLLLEMPVF